MIKILTGQRRIGKSYLLRQLMAIILEDNPHAQLIYISKEGQCDLYCTGSNANMLSGELATYLAGRYMEFHVHSLSYAEFLSFYQLPDTNESLQKYMRIGGMPYLIHLNADEQLSFEYLRNLYATILLKDVIARKQIRNVDFLERLVQYIADNVGSLFSSSKLDIPHKTCTWSDGYRNINIISNRRL